MNMSSAKLQPIGWSLKVLKIYVNAIGKYKVINVKRLYEKQSVVLSI